MSGIRDRDDGIVSRSCAEFEGRSLPQRLGPEAKRLAITIMRGHGRSLHAATALAEWIQPMCDELFRLRKVAIESKDSAHTWSV